MKILNLYAGIGGNRKLWGEDHDITAIEWDHETAEVYQSFFPNDKVIVTDAHQYLLDHYKEYDFIWSSPPCPTHSQIRRCGVYAGQYKAKYADMVLYQEIILLKYFNEPGTKWIVENVNPYYDPLIHPTKKLGRHLIWSNFPINHIDVSTEILHTKVKSSDTVYGFNIANTKIKNKVKALRNMVNPKLGLHVLQCAEGVIAKQNEKQIEIF